MAMSGEEQKAEAQRILEKHPLTEEERRTYEMLTKKPEEYPEKRVCLHCEKTFNKEDLAAHADHLASHSLEPGRWGEAHKRIEAAKEKLKN